MGADDRADVRDGVALTNLDQVLFDGAGATKRDLVDYLDAVAERMAAVLADRPLSVIRARPGQAPFMQKNVPKSAPAWLRTVSLWAETSRRSVAYALCDDRRSLLWFANQRAIEYHPALVRSADPEHLTHLVLDLDPPPGAPFTMATEVALAARAVLADAGLQGAVKTSGAKGLHIFVPIGPVAMDDAAAALRALAARVAAAAPGVATTAFLKDDRGARVFVDPTRVGGATVVAAYSPRARAGLPVSFPLAWAALEAGAVDPAAFTVFTALDHLGASDPWAASMPPSQAIDPELVAEGRAIPVPRVAAMHEGKRRRRAQAAQADQPGQGDQPGPAEEPEPS